MVPLKLFALLGVGSSWACDAQDILRVNVYSRLADIPEIFGLTCRDHIKGF